MTTCCKCGRLISTREVHQCDRASIVTQPTLIYPHISFSTFLEMYFKALEEDKIKLVGEEDKDG